MLTVSSISTRLQENRTASAECAICLHVKQFLYVPTRADSMSKIKCTTVLSISMRLQLYRTASADLDICFRVKQFLYEPTRGRGMSKLNVLQHCQFLRGYNRIEGKKKKKQAPTVLSAVMLNGVVVCAY